MLDKQFLISPSLLAADFSIAVEELQSVADSGTDYIHLDVMDGAFVPNITFGPKFIKDIRAKSDLVFDVHLMVDEPERYIKDFIDAGSNIITIHSESTKHIFRALSMIKDGGCECGVAINPGTSVSMIDSLLDYVDYILVMTVNPGFGGQRFIPDTLRKIRALDELRQNNGYKYLISVDGGISMQTIRDVYDAGADMAVIGTAFFRETDRKAFIEKLEEELS